MATKQHPRFINVGGQLYQLETAAGDAAGREPPVEEPTKQNTREFEQYLSGKGSEKLDSKKEPKATEKSVTMPAASDKDNAGNIPDKGSSPDKDFYTGKKTKRDQKSFQLKGLSEKQYEENDPTKLPAKIKVKGEVYELVQEEPADDLPNQIRVKGEVYERLVPPPFLRVRGSTFVKLSHAEALEVLAKKGGDKWKKYLRGLSDEAKTSTKKCKQELKDKIEDAGDRQECCTWIKDNQAEKAKGKKK